MWTAMHTPKGAEKVLVALAEFDYLTAEQVTRLCYAKGSLTYVKATLKSLIAAKFAVALGGRGMRLPRVYTPTGTGYAFASAVQGLPQAKRVRPSEEEEKATNHLFLKHTIAVTDVLISARLLTQTVPGIVLTRMYTERELKRKIYVTLVNPGEKIRDICLEPDAAVDFVMQDKWQDFFHIEVYRTHLREYRFKQKIAGYAAYAASSIHQELFATPALAIAVFCASSQLAATLKHWTEEVLQELQQPELGERFFFTSIDPATASLEEIFLAPDWEQAFRAAKVPLLMLEENA
jgi:Replication-relaxation